MMEIQFNNVTITITAESPKLAYKYLCELFEQGQGRLEYTTDTFEVDPKLHELSALRDTSELWPE